MNSTNFNDAKEKYKKGMQYHTGEGVPLIIQEI